MKLGRLARAHNPRVPHYSALVAGRKLIVPPPAVDYTTGMPGNFGMMGNDRLGDCTCAAFYHGRQVWTFNASNKEDTQSDQTVISAYEQACGYHPDDPNSDQGGVEQEVLSFMVRNGAPLDDGTRDQLLAFVEIDPRNLEDVKRVIYECGGVYIGFNVPDSLMNSGVPQVWSDTSSQNIIGGHAVWLPGYDADGPWTISWGAKYKMSWGFFANYTDETYALVDKSWVNAGGMTPAGMTVAELESQMEGLKLAA